MIDKFDAFISHTSTDKDAIARPLAKKLSDYGLKIWFDEFTLEVGDSLLESIDKGLANSQFGIVILSKAFLEKGWTKYELKGLLTREIGNNKVVLPVWHNINRDEIVEISPTLADKFALNTSIQSIDEITIKLIQVIRPDIFENLARYVSWQRIKAESKIEYKKLGELKPAPIRHETLPENLRLRLKLVYEIIKEALDIPFSQFVQNFQRDMHPQDELVIWERIAVAYLGLIEGKNLTKKEQTHIFGELLSISMLPKEALVEKLRNGDENEVNFINAYVKAVPQMSVRKKIFQINRAHRLTAASRDEQKSE
jgi:hypothetical protein